MAEVIRANKISIFKRKHRKKQDEGEFKQQLTIERRACSNLFDLSESPFESPSNPEVNIKKNLGKETLYSPWKSKLQFK